MLDGDVWTYPIWEQLKLRANQFDAAGAWALEEMGVRVGTSNRREQGVFVSGGFFELLGVTPIMGRSIDTDDETRQLDRILRGGPHHNRLGLAKDVVGRHDEVRHVRDHANRHERDRHEQFSPTRGTPRRRHAGQHQRAGHDTERPSPRIQKVRDVDAASPLTVRQRHDEIDIGRLEKNQQQRAKEKEPFHGRECIRGRIRCIARYERGTWARFPSCCSRRTFPLGADWQFPNGRAVA